MSVSDKWTSANINSLRDVEELKGKGGTRGKLTMDYFFQQVFQVHLTLYAHKVLTEIKTKLTKPVIKISERSNIKIFFLLKQF